MVFLFSAKNTTYSGINTQRNLILFHSANDNDHPPFSRNWPCSSPHIGLGDPHLGGTNARVSTTTSNKPPLPPHCYRSWYVYISTRPDIGVAATAPPRCPWIGVLPPSPMPTRLGASLGTCSNMETQLGWSPAIFVSLHCLNFSSTKTFNP